MTPPMHTALLQTRPVHLRLQSDAERCASGQLRARRKSAVHALSAGLTELLARMANDCRAMFRKSRTQG